MAQKVAPPKNTGGGGFNFEDQVAAYFLSFLLVGETPFTYPLGRVVRVNFQTRVDGWLLDDLLLTLGWHDSLSSCALSVKSNAQFTARNAPPDFVRAIWQQFLQASTGPFAPNRDMLGIVVTPLASELSTGLQQLLQFARAQDPLVLPARLNTSGFASSIERALFRSFMCPPDLAAQNGVTESDIGRLLARVVVLECDFLSNPSRWWQMALANCQRALVEGTPEHSAQLWDRLLRLARDARPRAGYFDQPRLLEHLAPEFQMKLPAEQDATAGTSSAAASVSGQIDAVQYCHWIRRRIATLQPIVPLAVQQEQVISEMLQFTIAVQDAAEGTRGGVLRLPTAVQHARQLVLAGEPGSGKTTALWQIALTACPADGPTSEPAVTTPLPVLIDCTDYSGASLMELIQGALQAAGQRASTPVVEELARRGRLLLLCDNTESVRPGFAGELIRHLRRWSTAYPDCGIVATTEQPRVGRSLGWPTFRIQPLDPNNTEALLQALPGMSARDVDLVLQAVPAEMRHLVSSPLTLRLFAYVYLQGDHTIPQSQGRLYEQVVMQLLQRREARGSLTLTNDDKANLLALLARWMQDNAAAHISVSRFAELVATWIHTSPEPFYLAALQEYDPARIREDLLQSGLLQFTVDEQIEFVHPTFRAYFAARALPAADLDRVVPQPLWATSLVMWASLHPRDVTDALAARLMPHPVLLGRILHERNGRRAEGIQPPNDVGVYLPELADSFNQLAQHFAGLRPESLHWPPLPWRVVARQAALGGHRLTWRAHSDPDVANSTIIAAPDQLAPTQFMGQGPSVLLPAEIMAQYHPTEVAYLWLLRLLYDWQLLHGIPPPAITQISPPPDLPHVAVGQIAQRFAMYQALAQGVSEEIRAYLPFYAREAFDLAVDVDEARGVVHYAVVPAAEPGAGQIIASIAEPNTPASSILQEQPDRTWWLVADQRRQQLMSLHQELLSHLADEPATYAATQWFRDDLEHILPEYAPVPW